MWAILALVALVSLGFGAAILMARKTKAANVTIYQQQAGEIDLEDLATKVARAVAKEVAKEVLENLPKGYVGGPGGTHNPEVDIQIDESLIPAALQNAITETNLEHMAKEEKAVDKGLEKSKSKLAGILKRKKENSG